MVFRIPRTPSGKPLATANYDFLVPLTLNETNIERMLVQIMERAIKRGHASPRPRSAAVGGGGPANVGDLIATLSVNPKLRGFSGAKGRAILGGWLRNSILELTPVGKSKQGEQIDFVKPLTIAAYRSGLPLERSRHRKADVLTYRSMLAFIESFENGSNGDLERIWRENKFLSVGVDYSMYPYTNPQFNEKDAIDVETLLELRFLDGFEGRNLAPVTLASRSDSQSLASPIPSATLPLGRDLVILLQSDLKQSSNELLVGLSCVLALRLFQLPLLANIELKRLLDSKPENHMEWSYSYPNESEMYFDFTGMPGSPSFNLARQCVTRDLQNLADFFERMILVREADSAAGRDRDLREELDSLGAPERLARLCNLVNEPRIHSGASLKLQAVEDDLVAADNQENLRDFLDIVASQPNDLKALVEVVLADRGKDGLAGLRKWAYSTGGLATENSRPQYSILEGTKKAPSTWSYRMSESMLLTLIDLCFLDDFGRVGVSNVLPLRDLLARLNRRFGILIASAPAGLSSPEADVAVSDNLLAFKDRLKLLGYFEGLSDDFNAQYVRKPGA